MHQAEHSFEGTAGNNGTKSNPCLQGDIIGDWREEVLLRTTDNTALRLYVSTVPTEYRFHTFLEDPVYRISIATQNVGYNQPTQPGFYFGLKGVFRGCRLKQNKSGNRLLKFPTGKRTFQNIPPYTITITSVIMKRLKTIFLYFACR